MAKLYTFKEIFSDIRSFEGVNPYISSNNLYANTKYICKYSNYYLNPLDQNKPFNDLNIRFIDYAKKCSTVGSNKKTMVMYRCAIIVSLRALREVFDNSFIDTYKRLYSYIIKKDVSIKNNNPTNDVVVSKSKKTQDKE